MNIQAKVQEIREAVSNMNNLVDGLKGLQDAIVPNERISAVMGQTIVPLIANLETTCNRAVATCEQTVGECIQRLETIAVNITDRQAASDRQMAELTERVEDLTEALDTLAQAATRKRRTKA